MEINKSVLRLIARLINKFFHLCDQSFGLIDVHKNFTPSSFVDNVIEHLSLVSFDVAEVFLSNELVDSCLGNVQIKAKVGFRVFNFDILQGTFETPFCAFIDPQ